MAEKPKKNLALHPYYMSLPDDQHPLFLDESELSEDNEIYAAMKNIDNEGTLEEHVENLKHHGNVEFKLNKYRWERALELYDQAIKAGGSDKKAISVCWGNRAQVNLAMGNNRTCIDDCNEAIRLDPTNIKAYWRAAKASMEISKIKNAIRYCEDGLKVEPNNKALQTEKARAEKKLKEKRDAKLKKIQEKQQALVQLSQSNSVLKEEFDKRKIIMGRPLFDLQRQYESEIRIDKETGELHWPVMFLYEEHTQSEFIKDFNENHCFRDHLSYMFPPNEFAGWDREKKYKLDDLEIYFEANCVAPIDPKVNKSMKKRWIKVRQTTSLKTVLSHADCIVPGIPVFYIVVANSKFREVFLKKEFD